MIPVRRTPECLDVSDMTYAYRSGRIHEIHEQGTWLSEGLSKIH